MTIPHRASRRWVAVTTTAVAVGAAALVASTQPPTAAAPVPEAFAGYDNLDTLVSTFASINSINVPAGQYVITAKAFAVNNNPAPVTVICRLTAGTSVDESATTVAGGSAVLALSVGHTTSGPRTITLACRNATAATTSLRYIKLVAHRVNAVDHISM